MATTVPDIPSSLVEALRAARHVAALTGSGISAESGVPTFRDAQAGLWAKYRPEELATPQAFRRNPKLVWDWYTWRRHPIASLSPHSGAGMSTGCPSPTPFGLGLGPAKPRRTNLAWETLGFR